MSYDHGHTRADLDEALRCTLPAVHYHRRDWRERRWRMRCGCLLWELEQASGDVIARGIVHVPGGRQEPPVPSAA